MAKAAVPDEKRSTSTTPSTHAEPNLKPGPKPSLTLLFSLLPRRDVLLFVLPAILTSALAGAVAPFMTLVIGMSFDAFSAFPLSTSPPAEARHKLLHDVGIAALELLGLAAAALLITGLTSSLWVCAAERNVRALRLRVYNSVLHKEMAWFDSNMGAEDKDGTLGAGGLMARFTRETDDVRQGIAASAGFVIQHLTTVLAALALAFVRSWQLTLIILAPMPVLIFIQGLAQGIAGPLWAAESEHTATAASRVDRAVTAVSTVKAFNAQTHEIRALDRVLDTIAAVVKRSNTIVAMTLGASQFTAMSMFLAAFWFGAKLVRQGDLSPGSVMSVFWACLIATGTLQTVLPYFAVLGKGVASMAALVALIDEHPTASGQQRRQLRRIDPKRCTGQVNLEHISFAYPSRPEQAVLNDVSVYFPAGETTFIVGGSGSGKSTIAHILLRMYTPTHGMVRLDDQDIRFLDQEYMRTHVAGVSQAPVVLDMSIHDNVALGRPGASRKDIESACQAALLTEFIRDLPEGYETMLGTRGASLSGGQKQRLAIARAKLRDPTVLVLDEATSALDATSRLLVFEAIKHWRRGKTTIVITHDLSQIERTDFAYVLDGGCIVEQGFRSDLEYGSGSFAKLLRSQNATGGFIPRDPTMTTEQARAVLEELKMEEAEEVRHKGRLHRHKSVGAGLRPMTMGRGTWMVNAFVTRDVDEISDAAMTTGPPPTPPPSARSREAAAPVYVKDDEEFELEKQALKRSGAEASRRRLSKQPRKRWDEIGLEERTEVKVDAKGTEVMSAPPTSAFALMRAVWPTMPSKLLLVIGLLLCLANGAMTPLFSFVLSKLMFQVADGARDVSMIDLLGFILIGVTAADGILVGGKSLIMENLAMRWVTRLRQWCFELILRQDKSWFDRAENSPVKLMQVLVKDGDDARTLIASVLGPALVVVTMLAVGLVWALIIGWQLTLVGLGIAPLFAGTMVLQARLVSNCELRNKRAREEVAQVYYDAVANVRGIRAMAFERVFEDKFAAAVEVARRTGVRGAFVEGASMGVASALIYLAEAVLFYVGAVLMANGTYSYLRMVETLNLIVFSVTIAGQMSAFGDKIAKSIQAVRDFHRLLQLPSATREMQGGQCPPIAGHIIFDRVKFSYPERPDVLVADGLSMQIYDGEFVAIVGESGSGKSTVAALLQRLYEPDAGEIYIGTSRLRKVDAFHLRDHLAVVSQQPNLFDASVADNIAYGDERLTRNDVQRAAIAANVHMFVEGLPQGYDTMLGEDAALVSGGQAQRIQIARALARQGAGVLVLDECTSALDGPNQVAVMDAVREARRGRTTVVITHKLPVMRRCDRVIVLAHGRVAEEGSYTSLMRRKGVFAQLASGGEWDA